MFRRRTLLERRMLQPMGLLRLRRAMVRPRLSIRSMLPRRTTPSPHAASRPHSTPDNEADSLWIDCRGGLELDHGPISFQRRGDDE